MRHDREHLRGRRLRRVQSDTLTALSSISPGIACLCSRSSVVTEELEVPMRSQRAAISMSSRCRGRVRKRDHQNRIGLGCFQRLPSLLACCFVNIMFQNLMQRA